MAFGRRGLHTKVVLAAGVAFLAFAHVRADAGAADAPAAGDGGEDIPQPSGEYDEDGLPVDTEGNPIEPIDGEPAPEDDPVDPAVPAGGDVPAEPPVEEEPIEDPPADDPMPEPEMEVSAPSLEKAPVDAELMALTPPYMAFKDVEYTPDNAPANGVPVQDIEDGGITVESATDCAQACIDEPMCNAATWMGANPEWTNKFNCWLKTLGQTCEQPAMAEQVPNAFLLIAQEEGCPAVPGLPPNMGAAGAPAPAPTADTALPTPGATAPVAEPTTPVPPPPTTGPAVPPAGATGESGGTTSGSQVAPASGSAAGAFAGLAVAVVAVAAGSFLL